MNAPQLSRKCEQQFNQDPLAHFIMFCTIPVTAVEMNPFASFDNERAKNLAETSLTETCFIRLCSGSIQNIVDGKTNVCNLKVKGS